MPAPQKYPSPPEQLLTLAKAAKLRCLTFEEFWERAMPPLVPVPEKKDGQVIGWKTEDDGSPLERPARRLARVEDEDPPEGAVLWPGDTFERNCWYRAIIWGRENWRMTYDGLPDPAGEALNLLARL